MARFGLSAAALRDIESILDYTAATWGQLQARTHIDLLEARLAQRPQMGRSREDLAPAMRSFPHDPHVIYYLPSDAGIVVARILHQRQDVRHQFEDADHPTIR